MNQRAQELHLADPPQPFLRIRSHLTARGSRDGNPSLAWKTVCPHFRLGAASEGLPIYRRLVRRPDPFEFPLLDPQVAREGRGRSPRI